MWHDIANHNNVNDLARKLLHVKNLRENHNNLTLLYK